MSTQTSPKDKGGKPWCKEQLQNNKMQHTDKILFRARDKLRIMAEHFITKGNEGNTLDLQFGNAAY